MPLGHPRLPDITIDRRAAGNLAADPPELHVRRTYVLDGASEVDVAIQSGRANAAPASLQSYAP